MMRVSLLLLLACVLIGCKHLKPPVPLDQLNAEQMQGHAVFEQRCSICHNDRIDAPLHGPALVGIFQKPSLPSGAAANDDRVRDTVMHGHGIMVGFGDNVDPEDMASLLAYLHTL
jgi:mono/diheme cytochrome c family protein